MLFRQKFMKAITKQESGGARLLVCSVPSDASSDASFREESISTGVWEKNQSPPNSLPKLAAAGSASRSLTPELAFRTAPMRLEDELMALSPLDLTRLKK